MKRTTNKTKKQLMYVVESGRGYDRYSYYSEKELQDAILNGDLVNGDTVIKIESRKMFKVVVPALTVVLKEVK